MCSLSFSVCPPRQLLPMETSELLPGVDAVVLQTLLWGRR